ncbi:hypothetical protein VISI1226_15561 [Vibrio sinaloensis DSM 21326]|uniref:Uncharacterized protein n=1 Tax=Vibrio sinaloensis DSM 21326 TaxID=945550 RepID=E8MCZ5_PHOS4|nr:hypothetical protein [Vibrio sinaloensis]EGA68171.1 hypothetical protein VISI1226_15561 [Vibrio sinaloensis DSM 21326]
MDTLQHGLVLVARWLVFLPAIFCFSYLLRPVLMMILIPGALLFLAMIGGSEVRGAMKDMMKALL